MLRWVFCLLVSAVLVLTVGVLLIVVSLVRRSDGLSAWVMHVWARGTLRAAGVKVIVEGVERVPDSTPCFFVGNHQSALDIPILLLARRGRAQFLAKESLFRIPIFGWSCLRAGHLPISRSRSRVTLERLEKMLKQVREHPVSLAVFPEGTRSPDGRLLPFRRGTMKICQRAGLTIVPFAISGSLGVLRRGSFQLNPGTVRIRFAEPIPPDELSVLSADRLLERVVEAVAGVLDVPTPIGGVVAP